MKPIAHSNQNAIRENRLNGGCSMRGARRRRG
jgi:hypothetical protein